MCLQGPDKGLEALDEVLWIIKDAWQVVQPTNAANSRIPARWPALEAVLKKVVASGMKMEGADFDDGDSETGKTFWGDIKSM